MKKMTKLDKVLNILGFEKFKELDEIIEDIKKRNPSQDFSSHKDLLIKEEDKTYKLWLILSKTDAFIVLDDGFELKTLLTRKIADFKNDITYVTEDHSPRLYIKDTVTTLPINKSYGSVKNFKAELENTLKA